MEREFEKTYIDDLRIIKDAIIENRNKAMIVVNSAMIVTYYKIGKIINKRKRWGNKFIKKLSEDLKEYGKGYSYEQLKKMSQFANCFFENEIRSQPVTQIPWGTLSRIIIPKSSSKEEALWYINQTSKNRWSRSVVMKQFELQAYQRGIIAHSTSTTERSNSHFIVDTFRPIVFAICLNETP